MTFKQLLKCLLTITLLISVLASARAQNSGGPTPPSSQEDVILQWNRVLKETVSTPGLHPASIMPVRSYAMMHAAMFDAVNSIEGIYMPYLTSVPGSKHASVEAAAAYAAYLVLSDLYPARASVFDAELADSLAGIDANRAGQGMRVGKIVADRLLKVRANDGWNATPPAYVLPTTPGNWQPTPPGFSAATFTHYPAVLPFAIVSSAQFSPNPPPALTSEQYAADFNEVKELGSVNSKTRTPD